MNKEKPKIFLSYAREDMGMAKQLYNDLKRYGLDVWLDTESLLPGDRWKDKIQEAIENSNYFIALLSSRSVRKKGFVQKELKTALEVLDLFPSSERFILPVRLDDCEIGERKMKEHHWVDLFPECEYENGLRKILQVVSPGTFLLRSEPMALSKVDINEMIIVHGFYEKDLNPEGKGFLNNFKFKNIRGDKIVLDEATGMMWQQSGSDNYMNFMDAEVWINYLNENKFAGFNDWRLPTLEEAMSLMETVKNSNELYINPIFDDKQIWIWTADQMKGGETYTRFVLDFASNKFDFYGIIDDAFVRAVRSGQASQD